MFIIIENYRLFKLWSEVMRNAGQINEAPESIGSEDSSTCGPSAFPTGSPPLFVKIPRK